MVFPIKLKLFLFCSSISQAIKKLTCICITMDGKNVCSTPRIAPSHLSLLPLPSFHRHKFLFILSIQQIFYVSAIFFCLFLNQSFFFHFFILLIFLFTEHMLLSDFFFVCGLKKIYHSSRDENSERKRRASSSTNFSDVFLMSRKGFLGSCKRF